MYLAAALRDAVTNFEVYLERAREEVLKRHGSRVKGSPSWHELKGFFDMLEVTIESGGVRRVRELRHFLTHQRGELRTEAQRKSFAVESASPIPPIVVKLSEEVVAEAIGQLRQAVRAIDPAVWKHTFGGKRLADH